MKLTGNVPELYWESTYAIAMALIDTYPQRRPEDIGLYELISLVVALPGFHDDPAIVTDQILLDIQNVWYEEITSL
ncbi:MAG: Fe-S cluster assembly protein IscX [Anaerolineales bacterium]|nr:Fe-S cluster assembly protein IscX [Anaerolineales bacterium]